MVHFRSSDLTRVSIKQWENRRDEPDLPQRKNCRATSNNTDKILASLIDPKRRLKHVSNISDNNNEHIVRGAAYDLLALEV